MANEVSGVSITMSDRRSGRIKKIPVRFNQETEIIRSVSESKQEVGENNRPDPRDSGRGKRRGRGAGGGARRGVTRPTTVLQENGQAEARQNNHEEIISVTVTPAIPVVGVNESDHSVTGGQMSLEDVTATLSATRDEMATYMAKATGVFYTLFSVLTLPQVSEIESSYVNEIKENELLNKCVNEAKTSLALKVKTYKDAVLIENKRNGPVASGKQQPNDRDRDLRDSEPATIAQNDTPMNSAQSVQTPSQRMSEAEKDWKLKFDEKRKKNIIVTGMHDTNIKEEDEHIIKNMLRYIGCEKIIPQIRHFTRLGPARFRRNRLLMICFDEEKVAKRVLDRSPKLQNSEFYEYIYVNKDLPREQRRVSNRDANSVSDSARGARVRTHATHARRQQRAAVVPNLINNNSWDNQNVSSDSEDSDPDDSSDSGDSVDSLNVSSSSEWEVVDEVGGDDTSSSDDENNVRPNTLADGTAAVGPGDTKATGATAVLTAALASLVATTRMAFGLEDAINVVERIPEEATCTETVHAITTASPEGGQSEFADRQPRQSGEENDVVEMEISLSGNEELRGQRVED